MPFAEFTLIIKNCDEHSHKPFVRGLTGIIQDVIRLGNPDILEVATSVELKEKNKIISYKILQSKPANSA